MKKLVGFTSARLFKDGSPHRDFVNTTYSRAIAAVGALPVLLPTGDPTLAADYLDRLDGLLLPGGIDVEPTMFGQTPHAELGETDGGQDAFEIAIAREAWRRRMPIFAICRGIQLLNVALGGTLIQDLPSQAPSSIAHKQAAPRAEATHEIEIEPDSRLFRLVGGRMAVNSFHHQSVDVPAPELHVVARAADGVVEAVESSVHPHIIAVQCHPEEMAVCDPGSQALFRQFAAWL